MAPHPPPYLPAAEPACPFSVCIGIYCKASCGRADPIIALQQPLLPPTLPRNIYLPILSSPNISLRCQGQKTNSRLVQTETQTKFHPISSFLRLPDALYPSHPIHPFARKHLSPFSPLASSHLRIPLFRSFSQNPKVYELPSKGLILNHENNPFLSFLQNDSFPVARDPNLLACDYDQPPPPKARNDGGHSEREGAETCDLSWDTSGLADACSRRT